ncbi:MAG: copper resistance protein CopC/CopD [Anaerolineales bacterium]|nr:copper resistance protein CopC/CopD [Anaerolineales bacterium]
MKRVFIASGLALSAAAALVWGVWAHASILSSQPASGELLQAAPAEIILTFTEEIDPAFSQVQLFNSAKQLVNPGPGNVDASAPRVLRLPLEPLPQDSYTAVWRVRSNADGHVTEGAIPFGVGVDAELDELTPPPGFVDPALRFPPLLESSVRWLNFVGLALAYGGVVFWLLVVQPLAASLGQPLVAGVARSIRRSTLAGSGLLLLATLGLLAVQALNIAGADLWVTLAGISSGYIGRLWWARSALALASGVLAWRALPAAAPRTWRLLAGLGGLAVLTVSLTAHAAALRPLAPLAIVADWLHVAATVSWLGGLLPLLDAVVRSRQASRARMAVLVPRFSRLAIAAVVLLALTGLLSYWLHIGQLWLLPTTSYGRALIAKTVLFAGLLGLGAINLRILTPRLRKHAAPALSAFGRTIRTELLLGLLVLLLVGAMTSIAPSQAAWAAHAQAYARVQVHEYAGDEVRLTVYIAPAQVGVNQFTVDVNDARRNPQQLPSEVLLRFSQPGSSLGIIEAQAAAGDAPGRYAVTGNYLSLPGSWQVEVILRRGGANDVSTRFILPLKP